MAEEITDDQLREMAQHRGLKLIKSKKRKPGVGDYGKYGLTDAAGKALLGVGDDGLTANAADIQAYLRTSALGTWKQSAETTPDRPKSPKKPRSPAPDTDDAPVRRRSRSAPVGRKPVREVQQKPALRLVPKAEPAPEPEPQPAPEPVLRVRTATAHDAAALARLLNQLSGVFLDRAEVVDNLARVSKAKGGMVVAELDDIIGCCGWAVVPTVHRGPVGRLTVLVVDAGHRRSGVATTMLAAAEAALAKAGCRQVEVMSDIAINNSHNFFRSLKFEQASYRFARPIGEWD